MTILGMNLTEVILFFVAAGIALVIVEAILYAAVDAWAWFKVRREIKRAQREDDI